MSAIIKCCQCLIYINSFCPCLSIADIDNIYLFITFTLFPLLFCLDFLLFVVIVLASCLFLYYFYIYFFIISYSVMRFTYFVYTLLGLNPSNWFIFLSRDAFILLISIKARAFSPIPATNS
jgi:hypothetical protein